MILTGNTEHIFSNTSRDSLSIPFTIAKAAPVKPMQHGYVWRRRRRRYIKLFKYTVLQTPPRSPVLSLQRPMAEAEDDKRRINARQQLIPLLISEYIQIGV